jgi:hypothetical protein
MTADTSTRKVSLIDKSALAFGAALVVFLISLWTGPISIPNLLVGAGLGLLLGWSFVFTYAKSYGDLILAFCPLVLIVAQITARYLFFSPLDARGSGWSVALQFFGLAYAIILACAWAFRNRVVASLRETDAEQIVERERR